MKSQYLGWAGLDVSRKWNGTQHRGFGGGSWQVGWDMLLLADIPIE